MWLIKYWALLHDNAPAHVSLVLRQFLAATNTTFTPSFLHTGSVNFYYYPTLKLTVKWRLFDSTKKIQAELQDVIKTLKQYVFQQCFQSFKYRWNRCVSAEEDYFEEDGGEKKFPSAVKMRQRYS
jgi:hypothetical protein